MTDPAPHRRSLLAALRGSFLTGLVVVLPVGLTFYVVWAVVGWIDGWILPLIPAAYQPDALVERIFGPEANFPVRGMGLLAFIVVTTFVGWLARGLIGRSVVRQGEDFVARVPLVRSVYSGLKQITETFFANKERSFDRTCLIEFPRPGYWAVGMVATRPKGEIAARLPEPEGMVAVFVGLTPLTSGFLVFVPEKDIIPLDLKTDEVVKLIVSAGLVYPASRDQIQAAVTGK